jgi:hypothetical protein
VSGGTSGQPKAQTGGEGVGPTTQQSEMYVRRALEEFHHSANGPDLWVEVYGLMRGSRLESAQAKLTAINRRLHFLRSTILFAAIAAEAFANELLYDLLSRADADALDRLEPAEKLLIGTRVATEGSPLARDCEPMQGLVRLSQTRNRLVHPRPAGGYVAWAQDHVEARDDEGIGPAVACKAILVVADTIVACNPLREHPRLYGGVAKTIARNRPLVERIRHALARRSWRFPRRTTPACLISSGRCSPTGRRDDATGARTGASWRDLAF